MKKIFAFLMALMMVFGLAPMLNLAKTAEATEEWALVTWDQITTDDTFLIAVNKAGTAYALPNAASTVVLPVSATLTVALPSITLSSGLSSAYTWKKTADAYIQSAADAANYLYVIVSNAGTRVGTTTAAWSVATDASSNVYLTATDSASAARYIGVYNTQDFRTYTAMTAANIAGQNTLFYKLTTTSTCTHVWGEGVVTTAATCTTAGVTTYTCTLCGETYTAALPEALGHSWDAGTITTAATCTEAGVMTYTCTVCSETKTEAIAATGHTYVGGVCTVCGAAEPTAVTYQLVNDAANLAVGDKFLLVGTNGTIFKAAGAPYAASGDTYLTGIDITAPSNGVISITDEAVVPFTLGGATGAWTLTSDSGILGTTGSNNNINYSYTDTKAQWAITFSGDYATLQNVGTTTRYLYYNASYPRFAAYAAKTMDNSYNLYLYKQAGGCTHVWDAGTVTTAATCGADGVMTYTCTLCGVTKTEAIAATGVHTYGTTATSNNDGTHYYTCTVCGAASANEACTIVSGTCTVCGYVVPTAEYTINFTSNGAAYGEAQVVVAGNTVTLPTAPTAAGYTFVGWVDATGFTQGTTTIPATLITADFAAAADVTLAAVFSVEQAGAGYTYNLVPAADVTAGTYIIGALRSATASDNLYFATGVIASGDLNTNTATTTVAADANGARILTTLPTDAGEFIFTGDNTTGFTISVDNATFLGYTSTTSSRKLAFSADYATTLWAAVAKDSPLLTNGVYLNCTTGTNAISENSTSVGAIRNYYTGTVYRAIYLFKKTAATATAYYTILPEGCLHTNTTEVAAVDATCTTVGYTAGVYCNDCATYISGHEEIAALGHDLSAWTDNGDGTHIRSCSRCDYTESGYHTWVNDVCSVCSAAATGAYTLVTADNPILDGDVVFIYYPNANLALTDTANGVKLTGAAAHLGASVADLPTGAVPMVAHVSGTSVSFERNGLYLTSAATGSGLSFAAAVASGETSYALWTLAASSDGTAGLWTLLNNNAVYNTTTTQYLEYYNGFTTYKMTAESAIYRYMIYRMVCTHATSVAVAEIPATCTATGVAAGTACATCGVILSGCETIPALGHSHEGELTYTNNANGTHTYTCPVCSVSVTEKCTFDATGVCIYCGTALADVTSTINAVTTTILGGTTAETKTVKGVITYINATTTRTDIIIQDSTGGIMALLAAGVSVAVGDEVTITGTTSLYNALPEMTGCEIAAQTLAADVTTPVVAQEVTLATLLADPTAYMSELVTFSAKVKAYDSYGNPTFTDGTNDIAAYKVTLDTAAIPLCSTVTVTMDLSVYSTTYQLRGYAENVTLTAAAAHTYGEGVVTTAATCGADGVMTYTCSVCGTTYTEAIAATGEHTYGEGVVTTAATCGAAGVMTYTCTVCDATYTEAIAATGEHTFGDAAVVPSTCVTAGTSTVTCTVCGEVVVTNLELDANNHETIVEDAAVAATCTETGLTAGSHCSACGTTIVAQETVAALGHSYDSGVVTTAATCTVDGVKTFTCTVCGDTYTEAIAATGHTAVADAAVAATCTETGLTAGSHCSVCGETIVAQEVVPALGHTLVYASNNDGTHNATCSTCGEQIVTNEACTYADGVCTLCGYTQPATGLKGDVNCDGSVNAQDAKALLLYVTGGGTLTAQGILNAETDNVSSLTSNDAKCILAYITGTAWPV